MRFGFRKTALALIASAISVNAAATAELPPLPDKIDRYEKRLIKYKNLDGQRATDGKKYDIKVQYGRGWQDRRVKGPFMSNTFIKDRAHATSFTRILISPAGKNDFRKPSANRLETLFPGSLVTSSIRASGTRKNQPTTMCTIKKLYKTGEHTTYAYTSRFYCPNKGMTSGHIARVGNVEVVRKTLK